MNQTMLIVTWSLSVLAGGQQLGRTVVSNERIYYYMLGNSCVYWLESTHVNIKESKLQSREAFISTTLLIELLLSLPLVNIDPACVCQATSALPLKNKELI